MATGFGIDGTKDVNGNITSGTSSQDIRKIFGGMFTTGVLRGLNVTTSSTSMDYVVSPGSAIIAISGGNGDEVVPVPGYGATVTTAAGGASARTDHVYIKQNRPSVEGNSNIVYGVTNTMPTEGDGRLVLKSFTVPANMTNTSQASVTGDVRYATPYGSAGRILVDLVDTYSGAMPAKPSLDQGGSFSLTTDRMVRIDITTTIDCEVVGGVDEGVFTIVYVDGQRVTTFSSGYLSHNVPTSHSYSLVRPLSAGNHNVTISRQPMNGNKATSKIYFRYGGSGGYAGQRVYVTDAGIVK